MSGLGKSPPLTRLEQSLHDLRAGASERLPISHLASALGQGGELRVNLGREELDQFDPIRRKQVRLRERSQAKPLQMRRVLESAVIEIEAIDVEIDPAWIF